jgi:hypothetical protein
MPTSPPRRLGRDNPQEMSVGRPGRHEKRRRASSHSSMKTAGDRALLPPGRSGAGPRCLPSGYAAPCQSGRSAGCPSRSVHRVSFGRCRAVWRLQPVPGRPFAKVCSPLFNSRRAQALGRTKSRQFSARQLPDPWVNEIFFWPFGSDPFHTDPGKSLPPSLHRIDVKGILADRLDAKLRLRLAHCLCKC